jgi:hypothetical protein
MLPERMSTQAIDNHGNTTEIFWGEIAPCEHLLQIYPDEAQFITTLTDFVTAGLRANEGVIVLATSDHLHALEDRLRAGDSAKPPLDLDAAVAADRYVAMEAPLVLAKFMVDGWPDEYPFDAFVTSVLKRAGRGGRRVRAFGELVALLWRQGHSGATVRLEHLWHNLCHQRGFSLFCAYPKIGFTQDADASIKAICDTHSKVLAS